MHRGYNPSVPRDDVLRELIDTATRDPAAFLRRMDDPLGGEPPVILPDGSTVARLPSVTRWMWDGEFCGSISLRYQPGTYELPPTCLGHVGYSVVPWKRRRGYATAALREFLPVIASRGMAYVDIVTDETNLASQQVVRASGGVEVERFVEPPATGGQPAIRWRITLDV